MTEPSGDDRGLLARATPVPDAQMPALIARGLAAYSAYLDRISLPPENMPIGLSSVALVTREDYLAHAEMLLDYAATHRSIYILGSNGSVVALMCRQRI